MRTTSRCQADNTKPKDWASTRSRKTLLFATDSVYGNALMLQLMRLMLA
jgi:hypothetical protein